jgi:hypothetical protein
VGWALLALALQSPSLFPCQLAVGTTRRGDLGASVPVFLSPTACHLPIHLLAIVSVQPTLHPRERIGWWGAWVVIRGEGAEGWVVCRGDMLVLVAH